MKTIDWQNGVIKAGGWPQLERNLTLDPHCAASRWGRFVCSFRGHRPIAQTGTTFYTVSSAAKNVPLGRAETRQDMTLTRTCCERCGQPMSGWRIADSSLIQRQNEIIPSFVTPV